jgi:SAM-dependent methyltransferase
MSSKPSDLLACPVCHRVLERIENGELACPSCNARYASTNGVADFSGLPIGKETAGTVAQFGASWAIHDDMEDFYEGQFMDWIAPLAPSDFANKTVLEAGCGKGRHSRLVASWDPAALYSVDLSEAVFLAEANTREAENVTCVRANLLELPFPDSAFDLAFCVGVLHHLQSPERGLKELWRVLKPGGTLCLWVYAREGNGWVVWLVDPIRKGFTSRIPTRLLRPIVWPLSAFLFMVLKTIYAPLTRKGERTVNFLPYSAYLGYISKFPFREIDSIVLDHLCPPIAYYLKKETLQKWFDGLGAKDVRFRWHNKNSWNVVATKR